MNKPSKGRSNSFNAVNMVAYTLEFFSFHRVQIDNTCCFLVLSLCTFFLFFFVDKHVFIHSV